MFPEQRQSKAATTIAACMKEHGIKNVTVTEKEDEYRSPGVEKIIIRKKVNLNGESRELSYNFRITEEELIEGTNVLEVHANSAARSFKDKLTINFSFDGRASATVCLYDGVWAECDYCTSKVDLKMSKVSPVFTEDAECSTPNPLSMERKTAVEKMSGHQKVACRLYLLGKLRRECGGTCPTSLAYQKI